MKVLFKIYAACSVVITAFFVFFMVTPLIGLLPLGDAGQILVLGGVIAFLPGIYLLYIVWREGFDFGWLLSHRGGFWAILILIFGLAIVVCGTLVLFWPGIFMPAFEQGALPFGILLITLFWLALIVIFAFLGCGMIARGVGLLRMKRPVDSIFPFAVGIFCSLLSGLFFSIYLDVLNDTLIRISEAAQWNGLWGMSATLVVASAIAGAVLPISAILDKDEIADDRRPGGK